MKQIVTRQVVIILLLFASALFLFDLAVTKATTPQKQAVAKSSGSQVADLYRNNCARCHGADGAGDTPLGQTYNAPNFTDPDWWRKHSDIASSASLASIVTRGKGGMPAFGKKLTRSQIRHLVDYVRRFRNQKS